MLKETKRVDVHHHITPIEYVERLKSIGITESLGVSFPKWTPKTSLNFMKNINRRSFLKTASLGAVTLTAGSLLGMGRNPKEHPNIIFILADDLGYGDVSCLNPDSKILTPNIDRLAKQGMTFTDAHSNAALCSPTRYGVLTGRYSWRRRRTGGALWSFDLPSVGGCQAARLPHLETVIV